MSRYHGLQDNPSSEGNTEVCPPDASSSCTGPRNPWHLCCLQVPQRQHHARHVKLAFLVGHVHHLLIRLAGSSSFLHCNSSLSRSRLVTRKKSLVLVCLQWLFGFVNFWFLKASEPTRILLLPLHVSAGLAIFLLTVCTAETGFVQIDAAPGAESRLINFTGLFILLFAVAVSISVALPRVSI